MSGEIRDTLTGMLRERGASVVGFADLRDIPVDVPHGLPFGVSIGLSLSPAVIGRIERGPTAEYHAEYVRANERLSDLASHAAGFLRDRGFRAVVQEPTVESIEGDLKRTLRTPLPQKTVATIAGIGWIGKNALVITGEFGSALRLSSVLTDAVFEPGTPVTESRCIAVCPWTKRFLERNR